MVEIEVKKKVVQPKGEDSSSTSGFCDEETLLISYILTQNKERTRANR